MYIIIFVLCNCVWSSCSSSEETETLVIIEKTQVQIPYQILDLEKMRDSLRLERLELNLVANKISVSNISRSDVYTIQHLENAITKEAERLNYEIGKYYQLDLDSLAIDFLEKDPNAFNQMLFCSWLGIDNPQLENNEHYRHFVDQQNVVLLHYEMSHAELQTQFGQLLHRLQ